MKLYLVAFGKLKIAGLREAADYYAQLLKAGVPFEEVELKPLPIPDKSPASRQRIQEKEGELLLEKLTAILSSRGRILLLDERGKARTTLEWAQLVTQWKDQSIPEIALCIGGSLGFSDAVRKRAQGLLSLGPQTLPHELARVVLLEQLYRAWSVTQGHPYHNESDSNRA